jgi:phosphoglucomutase
MKEAEKLRPDLIIATDPDSDRLACAVRRGNGYTFLSGNEVGCLFVYYMLTELKAAGRLPETRLSSKPLSVPV